MADIIRVRIDVGGNNFTTNFDTVTKHKAAGSHLSRVFNNEPIATDDKTGTKEYFIDRDPRSFSYILQWLRDDRAVIVHSDAEKDRLLAECRWYGPFVGGDPIIMTEAEYHHCKVFGNGWKLGCVPPPAGCGPPAGSDHVKQKFYSLQLN